MTDPGPAEAVCFDLDDTLFDYTQYIRAGLESAADLVQETTGRTLHDDLLGLYFDEGVTEGTFDVFVDRHDLSADLVPDLVEAYHRTDGPLDPYPDTTPVLSTLSSAYDLGLVTDGRNGTGKLSRLGLSDYFAAVVVTPNHDITKRDPEAFERLVDALEVDPRAVVYVGDNPRTDFYQPDRLGMTTVRILRGRFTDQLPPEGETPDFEIVNLHELLHLIER